jgi:hypothetical protein
MTSEYSISVDWSEEREDGKWEFKGADLMREFYENNPKEAKADGHDVERGKVKYIDEVMDAFYPMMNYAYPLATTPDDDKIIQVCRDTNLTVVYNNDDDTHYLALTGGGMDLSQDIARAYQILETWIPVSLLTGVCTQPELSVHGQNWLDMANQIREQIKIEIGHLQQADDTWEKSINTYNAKRKPK